MAIDKPLQVKAAKIVSSDIMSFASGLDERGDYNITPDSYSRGRNVMVNSSNNLTKRFSRQRWLPDSIGFNSEVSTVYYNDQIYYFIADGGRVKYIQDNGTAWIDCGGTNAITTTTGLITTFLRTNDILLCMNGTDTLRYIDLSNLQMTQFTAVINPVSNITAAATGITVGGGSTVYYGFTYNSDGGVKPPLVLY